MNISKEDTFKKCFQEIYGDYDPKDVLTQNGYASVMSAMTEYVHQALNEAAEKAEVTWESDPLAKGGRPMPCVDKQSILKLKEKY